MKSYILIKMKISFRTLAIKDGTSRGTIGQANLTHHHRLFSAIERTVKSERRKTKFISERGTYLGVRALTCCFAFDPVKRQAGQILSLLDKFKFDSARIKLNLWASLEILAKDFQSLESGLRLAGQICEEFESPTRLHDSFSNNIRCRQM